MKMLVHGKIPNFNDAVFYQPAVGEKKSFCRVKVNVSTGRKEKDANGNEGKYYETETFTVYGYGKPADDFLRFFKPGDKFVAWTYFNGINMYNDKKTGELKKGGIDCRLDELVLFPDKNNDSQQSNGYSPNNTQKKPEVPQVPNFEVVDGSSDLGDDLDW